MAVDIGQQRPLIPLQIDPPDHVKYRRVLDPHLAPRQIVPREDRMRAVVNELIDRFIERGSCDFHAELSVPLPCTVFLELCGLPLSELDTFLGWKDDIIRPQMRHPEIAFDVDALGAMRRKTGTGHLRLLHVTSSPTGERPRATTSSPTSPRVRSTASG